MERITFNIELNSYNNRETLELLRLIRSYNLEGLLIEPKKNKPMPGEMASAEISNILTIVLSCSAISVTLKGLFDLIKTHMQTRRNKGLKIKYKDIIFEFSNFENKEITEFIEILKNK